MSFNWNMEMIKKLHPMETPCFVLSTNILEQKYKEYIDLFPNSLIQYAVKANAETEVLKKLSALGSGFEVASIFEFRLLKEVGVPAEKIIFGNSIKPQKHIKEAFDNGVRLFAFDSLPEIEKISIEAPGAGVYVRISVDDKGSVFRFSEKFGTPIENAIPFLLQAKKVGLLPLGISFHVGSQSNTSNAWKNAIESLVPILKKLEEHDIKIEILNIGGGFPIQYLDTPLVPQLSEIASAVYHACKLLPYQPKLMLEPGRGLVGSSGCAIGTIIAKVERETNTWLFLDLGVYNGLFEAMAYQGSTRYQVELLENNMTAKSKSYSLAGPSGDSPDIIIKNVLLPENIEVGQKIIFYNTGAYSLVACSPFNGFPKPRVYLV